MCLDTEMRALLKEYLDCLLDDGKFEYHENALDLNIAKVITSTISIELQRRYEYQTPLFGWMDLTSQCNFRCIHCLYNDSGYSGKNELTPQETMRVIDELINDFGIVLMILTGGEIFLRPDLMDIVEKFKRNNVALKLLTNAALITDEHISRLAELLNPYTDGLQISLDGATTETYGKIRQTDLFDVVINNIKKLLKNNIRVEIGTIAMPQNYEEIPQIFKLATELGANKFTVSKMIERNESHKALAISDKDLLRLAIKLYHANTNNNSTELALTLFNVPELLAFPEARSLIRENKQYRDLFKLPIVLRHRSCNFQDRINVRANGDVYMCMMAEACKNSLMGNFIAFFVCLERMGTYIWKRVKAVICFMGAYDLFFSHLR